MPQLFFTPAELAASGYIFRITDNRGETADRYTILFSDGDYLGYGPGVSMWGEGCDPQTLEEWVESGEADDISYLQMSEADQQHILRRINECWRDFLEELVVRRPLARSQVEPNEGVFSSAGCGIYQDAGRFYIRREEDDDDLGPYGTAREALISSLPTPYSLAGPEYQSGVM